LFQEDVVEGGDVATVDYTVAIHVGIASGFCPVEQDVVEGGDIAAVDHAIAIYVTGLVAHFNDIGEVLPLERGLVARAGAGGHTQLAEALVNLMPPHTAKSGVCTSRRLVQLPNALLLMAVIELGIVMLGIFEHP